MTIWWIWLIIGIATGWLSATGWWLWLTRPPKAGAHRIEGTDIVYEVVPEHHANHCLTDQAGVVHGGLSPQRRRAPAVMHLVRQPGLTLSHALRVALPTGSLAV